MMSVINGIFIFLVLFLFWRINQYSEQVYLLRKEMKELRESNQAFLDSLTAEHEGEDTDDKAVGA
ncbi:hypothetical protein ACTNCI_05960 [Mitsuokella jalaludinii]|uniref:hypothetical protein n=1 Tax=Mitsuokella jalaludinii TaxID=187979 RepID=UPI003F8C246F